MMEKLWRYTPQSGFTSRNAGFSMWCFGTYQGKEYFIKQFLSPKYPADDHVSSPEKILKKQQACLAFESRKKQMYAALLDCSDGNDVCILEFFRVASRYYIVTEKVEALPWSVETIAALDEAEKRRLCAIIAHAIAALHKGGLIHSDIKHDNILYTYTEAGTVTAKIIDFDGSFLESEPPSADEGITGDMNYFSPEVCARTYGELRPLSTKLDVFALGILFHQYFSGSLPVYDTQSAACPGEAVLQGSSLQLSEALPPDIAALLASMLAEDPDARPTTQEVFEQLRPYQPDAAATEAPKRFCPYCGRAIAETAAFCNDCAAAFTVEPTGAEASPFFMPGDL